MSASYKLGFIGAGNMAEGILGAVLERKLMTPEQIVVTDVAEGRRKLFSDQFGVATVDSNAELVEKASMVVIAVKPQNFADLAGEVASVVTADHLLVSIMAGVRTARIEEAFPNAKPRVVRVMPNLPIRVGAGVAGICAGTHSSQDDLALVKEVFDTGGSSIIVDDEGLIDAVTAVSGSGPAYFYYFVEAMVEGGKACGLSEDDALRLAEYTCLGAARMMLDTQDPPAELRRKVTSKGGTTQAALEHMEKADVSGAIRDAVKAAFQRGRELGA